MVETNCWSVGVSSNGTFEKKGLFSINVNLASNSFVCNEHKSLCKFLICSFNVLTSLFKSWILTAFKIFGISRVSNILLIFTLWGGSNESYLLIHLWVFVNSLF